MRRFRRTTLITAGCVSALTGIGLARRVNLEPQTWWLLFSPLLLQIRRKNIISLFLIVFMGLSIGLWRGAIYMDKISELRQFSGQKVTIEAIATSDSIYGNYSQLEFTANNVRLIEPKTKELAGSFRISGFGEPMIYRGDKVQISGKVYPTRGTHLARISYGKLKRISADSSWINNFVRRFAAGIHSALPEPNSSFGLGILIGQRNTLPAELTNQLIMVGLVHIVAVSCKSCWSS